MYNNIRNDTLNVVDLKDVKNFIIDMDGVLLDISYDNYFWQIHMPEAYSKKYKCKIEQATKITHTLFNYKKGSREWYDLDYWSNILGIDVLKEKRSELSYSKIKIKDGVIDTLLKLRNLDKKLFLVTNAHTKTLNLKLEKYPLQEYFDQTISAHDFNYVKEDIQFWYLLRKHLSIEYDKSILIEDTLSNIKSAYHAGLKSLYVSEDTATSLDTKTLKCFSELFSCFN